MVGSGGLEGGWDKWQRRTGLAELPRRRENRLGMLAAAAAAWV